MARIYSEIYSEVLFTTAFKRENRGFDKNNIILHIWHFVIILKLLDIVAFHRDLHVPLISWKIINSGT
jgi:hypothetical protein